MSNILEEIVAKKTNEVAQHQSLRPLSELKQALLHAPEPRSLRASLEKTPGGIIAEFKRRSPSKGWIKKDARISDVIPSYERAGAAALSILTDEPYFGGTLNDIIEARPLTNLPILRKDFVVDAYQLYEARAAGADACLLIVAAIGPERCKTLAEEAKNIGLEVVLEIHSKEELEGYSQYVDVLGVNNRDLRVFKTSPQQSINLFPHLPKAPLPISESGLLNPQTAATVLQAGYRGLLIGEAFMRTEMPGEALKSYLKTLLM